MKDKALLTPSTAVPGKFSASTPEHLVTVTALGFRSKDYSTIIQRTA